MSINRMGDDKKGRHHFSVKEKLIFQKIGKLIDNFKDLQSKYERLERAEKEITKMNN
jgi:hypothetical protein